MWAMVCPSGFSLLPELLTSRKLKILLNPDSRRGDRRCLADGTGIQNCQGAVEKAPAGEKRCEHSLSVQKIPREQEVWVRWIVRELVHGSPENCLKITTKFLRQCIRSPCEGQTPSRMWTLREQYPRALFLLQHEHPSGHRGSFTEVFLSDFIPPQRIRLI